MIGQHNDQSARVATGPVLRPAATRRPAVDVARRARLSCDSRGLLFTDRYGTVHHYPVGRDGIAKAVLLRTPSPASWGHGGPPVPGSMGRLQLQDSDGRLVLRLDADDWVPESGSLLFSATDGLHLLEHSGLAELLNVCRIPLETVRDPEHPLLARVSWREAGRTYLRPGRLMPNWYLYTRRIALPLWILGFCVATLTGLSPAWMPVAMAAGGALWALNYMALNLWGSWRDRRTRPGVQARIGPAPAADAGATVRFVSTAAVRVQDDDIVIVSGTGEERWLPRSGPYAVKELARVVDGGRPIRAELRGLGGTVRAALPWQAWFGGPGGREQWQALVTAVGLPARDEQFDDGTKRKSKRRTDETRTRDTLAKADAFHLAPHTPKSARQQVQIPEGPLRVRAVNGLFLGVLGVMMGAMVISAIGEPALGWTTIALGCLTLAADVPKLARHLASRLWLDRPARVPSQVPERERESA